MKHTRYTVEKAAEILKTAVEYLYQLSIENKLRLGIEVRAWDGCWFPNFNDHDETDKQVPCAIDKNGIKTYSRTLLN